LTGTLDADPALARPTCYALLADAKQADGPAAQPLRNCGAENLRDANG
jgi:hypothetical protein